MDWDHFPRLRLIALGMDYIKQERELITNRTGERLRELRFLIAACDDGEDGGDEAQ